MTNDVYEIDCKFSVFAVEVPDALTCAFSLVHGLNKPSN